MESLVNVLPSDFEGRFYWIEEETGQSYLRAHGHITVRLPPPFQVHTIVVTDKMWKEALRTKRPRARRQLRTPSSLFQPLDDPTASSSSETSVSLSSSRGVIEPLRTQSAFFFYPEAGLERWLSVTPAADTSVEEMTCAIFDYARLLADTRWHKGPVDWTVLRTRYPRLLEGEQNLRVHALALVLRFMAAPRFWRDGKTEETIVTGIDEHYPLFLNALFKAEEAIVAAQCRAEAATADGALACLRVAQQLQSRSLGAPRLTEVGTGTRNPMFELDLQTRLLAGLGVCAGPVNAARICCQLLPRLHGRALKADVLKWIRDFAKQQPAGLSSVDENAMHPKTVVLWKLACDARPAVASALLASSPATFFIDNRRLGPSAFPDRVKAYLRDAAVDRTGKWRPPQDKTERRQRLNALNVDMEDLFRAAPPCMAAALKKARTTRHLKNEDRYPLSTWFSPLFPATDATDVARALFGGSVGGTFAEQKITRAIADAQNKPWSPFRCSDIIERRHGRETVIVCPYSDRAACVACYATEKNLPNAPPPLETPVDYVLFYKGR